MLHFVPRKCSTREEDPSKNIIANTEYFRQLDAYVLLGDPGAGKSRLFKDEADKTENGHYLTARDFIDYEREEWRGKVLFIDGLDETRAGRNDPHTPLGALRGKLDRLGRPRFRLSCRAADWLGNSDAEALKSCAPNGKVAELYLEPLGHEQVVEILKHDDRVQNAELFLDNAGKFNLEGLLYNPQTLDMMIDAVEGDTWPTTKLEVYELACKKLAVDAKTPRQPYTVPQLLDAAGWLFAVQLLANAATIRVGNARANDEIGLSDLNATDSKLRQAALGGRLFTYLGDDEYSYVHRSVAEYLGARFIAEKIKQGLPVSRILALATGFDGGVVAALRGLMAWLAALNTQARDRMIEIDPLGMVLYGDAQLFSPEAKVLLLDSLRREAEKTGHLNYNWGTRAFAALTTQDMMPHLLRLFSSPSREKSDQSVLDCVLEGLNRSPVIPGLQSALMGIVRDATHWEGVRVSALQAFTSQYPEEYESLVQLAEDIRLGKVEDNEFRLLGLLLYQLFPQHIPASGILKYLQLGRGFGSISHYEVFWERELSQRASDADLPILLDAVSVMNIPYLRGQMVDRQAACMAVSLLARGLQVYGEQVEVERLYRWLSIGLDEFAFDHLDKESGQQIKDWIGSHPERYLAILGAGIHGITDLENVSWQIYQVTKRLHGAKRPEGIGLWWLEQALAAHEVKLREGFFYQAFGVLLHESEGQKGLSLDVFEEFVAQYPEFADAFRNASQCDLESQSWRQDQIALESEMKQEREAELAARIRYFREHKSSIEEGRAHPQALHHLAAAWFDLYSGVNGKTGEERLSELLNNDEELIVAAKNGLCKILDRSDLPQVEGIFSLAVDHRQHLILLPFLVCMEKLYQENSAMIFTLSDELAEKALAFWYAYGAGEEPVWIKPLSLSRSILAAKVLTEYVRTMLAGKVQHITGLYQLVYDPDYRDVAGLVAIPLLESYPIRSNQQQISSLEYLLKAAIGCADRTALLALVEKRLALKGLDVAQRVYWLATGLIVAPEIYEPIVRKQIGGKVVRINHLSAFMYSGWHRTQEKDYVLSVASMGWLIELLGPRCTPRWATGDGFVTRADNERDYVQALLNKLGSMPGEDVGCVLRGLLAQPGLVAWHDVIRNVQQTQQVSRREATFRHPDIEQVIQSLDNRKPANVADLAALASDFLEKLAVEIRTSNTDSYKRFWNVDGYNKPQNPRPENSCRDYLVERLKPLLAPFDVDVQPETREAESKRADIRLSYRSNGAAFHLPIEIKLDHSPDLWRAIHEQLIPLYIIAPETGGRGILLVIWFNDSGKRSSAPPTGVKPKTADELARRLRDQLSPAEEKLIDVFVLDASNRRGRIAP
ncbi:MAG: hypothetical protein M0P59_14180 [Gallionella sp.]|jgi:hypothetical protein|nr:hypothetical protein [Gallionella sp.]MCK9355279.1 hypothetical protein [Gallionella sp.]